MLSGEIDMSGEGEFKKLLKFDSIPKSDFSKKVAVAYFYALLDEARQDFPKINTICLYESDDNYKVLKWFVKWFGGESK